MCIIAIVTNQIMVSFIKVVGSAVDKTGNGQRKMEISSTCARADLCINQDLKLKKCHEIALLKKKKEFFTFSAVDKDFQLVFQHTL